MRKLLVDFLVSRVLGPRLPLGVTEKIIATKVAVGIEAADVAAKVGLSKEWVTAARPGQMTLDK